MGRQIYLIGSLRNLNVPHLGNFLRGKGHRIFDDWFAAGPEADDRWQAYEQLRGRPYDVALKGEAAQNVFRFDHRHISESDTGVLYLPAGKSGHMELGVMIGMGKPGFIVMDKEPDRWDVMYNFAAGVCFSWEDLALRLGELE